MSGPMRHQLPLIPAHWPPNRRLALVAMASVPGLLQAHPNPLQQPFMQAMRYEAGHAVDGFLVSEKLDGVRAHWDGVQLWTRSGRLIATPPGFTQGWPHLVLEGELWSAPGQFAQAVAAVRDGPASPAWEGMQLMAFDAPRWQRPFGGPEGRLALLQAAVALARGLASAPARHLQVIEQHAATSPAQVKARLDDVLAHGGEGLMLHHTEAYYRLGRSPELLKYKAFDDAEAQVVQVLPGKGPRQGLASALLVQTQEGHRLRLGSGMSDAVRLNPPAVGSWVSFRYQGLHPGGMPRFATFLRSVPDVNL